MTSRDDWRCVPLVEVATLQRGFDLPSRLRRRGSVPIVSSSGVTGRHKFAMVKGPGVVTGRYGTIGQVFFQNEDFWPLNTTLWVSDFHTNDIRFIYYLLQRIDFATHSGKSGVPGVNRNDLHNEVVALPASVEEQSRIARALHDVDSLVTKLEQLLIKKQAIKQGMVQNLLSGTIRLPGLWHDWVPIMLGDKAQLSKGAGLSKTDLSKSGSLPCIHYGELFTSYGPEIETVVSRTHRSGLNCRSVALDVLMPTSDVTPRGLAKASAVMTAGVILGGDILVIRPSTRELYGPFLAHMIRHKAGQVLSLVRGSTVFHLYASDMRSFTFQLPELAEQKAICGVLRETQNELDVLNDRLTKSKAIKQAVVQNLLTGRTRLSATEVVR